MDLATVISELNSEREQLNLAIELLELELGLDRRGPGRPRKSAASMSAGNPASSKCRCRVMNATATA